MKAFKTYSLLAILCLVLVSCARLDSFMFNNDNTIVEYKLDDFDEEQDFVLDSDYDIADSLIHVFTLEPENDVEIWSIYIGDTNRISTDTVIMYCHGNAAHMDFYWQRAKLLANTAGKNRFGVLMIDYRAFGLSTGEPTENDLTNDVDFAIQWLQSKGLTGDRLAMYGFSLGSAPATDLVADPMTLEPAWLMLENPFASTEVMVQDASLLDMPDSFVTNAKYDNAEQIKKVEKPFLWMHGIDDVFLNLETHGEVVYKNYDGVHGEPVRVPGAGHSTLPRVMGFETYMETVGDFLTTQH